MILLGGCITQYIHSWASRNSVNSGLVRIFSLKTLAYSSVMVLRKPLSPCISPSLEGNSIPFSDKIFYKDSLWSIAPESKSK